MIDPTHQIGDSFEVQFVWQLPDGDYLRAIFEVAVQALDHASARYRVRLTRFVAGRQETAAGEMRPREALASAYWQLVRDLTGRQADLAYEAEDGRPLYLRLPTLTREHSFFTRYDDS